MCPGSFGLESRRVHESRALSLLRCIQNEEFGPEPPKQLLPQLRFDESLIQTSQYTYMCIHIYISIDVYVYRDIYIYIHIDVLFYMCIYTYVRMYIGLNTGHYSYTGYTRHRGPYC